VETCTDHEVRACYNRLALPPNEPNAYDVAGQKLRAAWEQAVNRPADHTSPGQMRGGRQERPVLTLMQRTLTCMW
jgi:hypothetical protein